MSEYENLAQMLEQAAALLRKADRSLSEICSSARGRIDSLAGYKSLTTRLRKNFSRSRNSWRGSYPALVYVNELCNQTADDLLKRGNFGEKCLSEIRVFLATHGLALRDDPEPEQRTGDATNQRTT